MNAPALRPEYATLFLLLLAYLVAALLSPFGSDPGYILESSTYYVELCIVALVLMNSGKGELKRVKGMPETADTVSKIPNAVTGNEEKN